MKNSNTKSQIQECHMKETKSCWVRIRKDWFEHIRDIDPTGDRKFVVGLKILLDEYFKYIKFDN